MIKQIIAALRETLFPVFCCGCGVEGTACCLACLESFPLDYKPACPLCGQHTIGGRVCLACGAASELDGLTALFDYHAGTVPAQLVRDFKYGYVQELKDVWQALWHRYLAANPSPWGRGVWSLIPVPLHARRLRERGFNQAALIAEAIGRVTGHTVNYIQLVRTRYTTQQARLNKAERQKNLAGAFAVMGGPVPENVLLVDDVFTTGQTMQTSAHVLKKQGAKRVWGLVLGRG